MKRILFCQGRAAPFALLALLAVFAAPALAQSGSTGTAASMRQPPSAFPYAKSGAYASVPAASPIVKKAITSTDLAALRVLEGKSATITGTVVKVFIPSNKSIVILDFAKRFSTAVSVVVRAEYGPKFPDLSAVRDHAVVVTGKVTLFRGSPEIALTTPSQIKLVK